MLSMGLKGIFILIEKSCVGNIGKFRIWLFLIENVLIFFLKMLI